MQWFQRIFGRAAGGAWDQDDLGADTPHATIEPPFVMRDRFLSDAEAKLLGLLSAAVGGQAIICPKVRVADVLGVMDASRNMDHAIAIDRKSVSFLLCDLETMRPRVAITALDASAQKNMRRAGVVEHAFFAAGLPVVLVSPDECEVDELSAQLLPMLSSRVGEIDNQATNPAPRPERLSKRDRQGRDESRLRWNRRGAPAAQVPVPHHTVGGVTA